MKLYKDSNNVIYNYPSDGSQDHLIGNKTAITQSEADAIVEQNLAAKGIPVVPAYVMQRSAAYPNLAVFADAWVKNDQAALEAYRQACLEVKARFPKPSES
jgi:hypothetical protein